MRGVLIGLSAALVALVWWLGPGGGMDDISAWAAEHQRDFQNRMALGLRAVRAGHPAAVTTLLGLSFAYGFFHAVGPGHGKVVIGGYGLARRVAVMKLSAIALLASLGQAVTAVVLVYGGLWIFGLGREQLVDTADHLFAPVSYGLIGLIGVWLLTRGALKLWRGRAPAGHAPHAGGHCDTCGHAHGPTSDQLEAATTWREVALVIMGIAIRPCTGALFVLVITYGMGIVGVGIAAAFAMALGTAIVTIAVGAGAAGVRHGFWAGLSGSGMTLRLVPLIEVAAGALVVFAAVGLLLRAI